MSKMLQAHVIAVSKGLSYAEAQEIVDATPGQLEYGVYHHCEDVAVYSSGHCDRIPEGLWNEDEQRYECPECQEEVLLSALRFSPYKIVSDEDHAAIMKKPREEYQRHGD